MSATATYSVQSLVRQGIEQSESIDHSRAEPHRTHSLRESDRNVRNIHLACAPPILNFSMTMQKSPRYSEQCLNISPFKRDCAVFGDSTPASNPGQTQQIVDIPRFSMVTRSHRKEQESQYLAKIASDEGFREIILDNSPIEATSARD